MPEQRSHPRANRVIALANQKGGTGKTTTTVNLGIGLARLGKKVLLIDADPQGDLTTCLGWQDQDSLQTTLATVMGKIIRDEPFTADEGILHHSEGVDLMPANIELSDLEATLVNAMSREVTLRTYVNEAKKNYDVVLIDCMPSLGMITINALAAADSVIIPVQAHYLPAKGMTQLIKNITRVKKRINPALKVDGVLLTLVDGRTNLARQTAETLSQNGIISDSRSFLDAVSRFPLDDYGVEKTGAEGFLFPDTYAFQKRMDNDEVIAVMTDNFFSKIRGAGLSVGERFYEGVVLASIIEKEYQSEEEAPLIASVFVNRLKKNMRLESCATVLYVLTDIQGRPHPERLFYTDLEVESPFNTYRNFGLPPAPISNPGLVALTAAFHPAQSEYLFFVVKNDGSGRHTFSKDFYTHNYHKRHN